MTWTPERIATQWDVPLSLRWSDEADGAWPLPSLRQDGPEHIVRRAFTAGLLDSALNARLATKAILWLHVLAPREPYWVRVVDPALTDAACLRAGELDEALIRSAAHTWLLWAREHFAHAFNLDTLGQRVRDSVSDPDIFPL